MGERNEEIRLQNGSQSSQLQLDVASWLRRANPLEVLQKHTADSAGKKMIRLPKPSVTLSVYPSSKLRPKNLTSFFGLNLENTTENVSGDLLNLIHSNNRQNKVFYLQQHQLLHF